MTVTPLERVRALRPAQPLHSDLPVVRVDHQLHLAVDAAVAALAGDRELYQRDGRLVRLVRVADADAEREGMAPGTPQIRDVPIANLRERLSRVAAFERYDARTSEWTPTGPPGAVVEAVAARAEWPTVRPITGLIETPSMRPDGSLLDVPGHDAMTGYVYVPSRAHEPIPASPSVDDAQRALAELCEPWADFPFVDSAQRYVPIAALMTLVARPAIRGACPAFLFDASTRGSGKSLCARVVTTLAQGREAALMSWPPEPVELEKVLGAFALRGAGAFAFDNVVGEFGGAPLDKVLTCTDRVELRVLGKSEAPAVPWRAVVLAGGNNLAIGSDTTRRVLVARLEPMLERPEERTHYAIQDLPAWCRANHPRMVRAALTVLRAFVVAGRPEQGIPRWGSFEAWRDLVASALTWSGGPDVMAFRPTIAGADDADTSALRSLLMLLPSFSREPVSLATLLGKLYTPERMRGNAAPDGWDGLRDALEVLAPPKGGQAPTAQRLGSALNKLRKRVVGGLYLDSERDRTNVQRWAVRSSGSQ